MNARPRLLHAMMVATALGLAACSEGAEARRGGEPAGALAPRRVELVPVERRALTRSVLVSGTLAAEEQVTVGAKVAGRLATIAVDLGSVVKPGQQLAQVEPTDYRLRVEQAESALAQARALLGLAPDGDDVAVDINATSLVQEAQATFEEARASFERKRTLLDQRLIAVAEFDTAKAELVRAETAVAKARDEIRNRQAALRQRSFELRSARQQLSDTAVRSPLDGVVQERLALAGEYLAAGAPVATIVRIDRLRLRVDVPERDAPLVRAGQRVRVRVDGVAQPHEGRVVRLAPALSEQNRSLAVEAELDNHGDLRPGSFARAEILVDGGEPALVVPASALVTFAGIEKLIGVERGKQAPPRSAGAPQLRAVEKVVTTGRRDGPWIEIVSGVAAGDRVVREPGNLQQGQPVEVAPAR